MKELIGEPLMALATLAPESSPVFPLMRYEEFLTWSDEDVHAEWVPVGNSGVGEVIIQIPPKLLHQRLVKFLSRVLDLKANITFLLLRKISESNPGFYLAFGCARNGYGR